MLSLNIYGLYFAESDQDLNGLTANIVEAIQSTADTARHLSFGWVAGVPQFHQHGVYITGKHFVVISPCIVCNDSLRGSEDQGA
jgi:hypothetical protein